MYQFVYYVNYNKKYKSQTVNIILVMYCGKVTEHLKVVVTLLSLQILVGDASSIMLTPCQTGH